MGNMANMMMLILLLFTCLSSLLKGERNVFLADKIAHKFLERTKRANSLFEELKKGNIERECYEERCSKEEAREAFEDQAQTEAFWNIYVDGDQCESGPCHYGGTCTDGINSYTCTCLSGYHGKNCETVIQKSCILNNGGCEQFCRLVENSISCSCADGYIEADDGAACVATVDYPCGKIQSKRPVEKKKRETSPFGHPLYTSDYDQIDAAMYEDDDDANDNFSNYQNVTTVSPQLHPQTNTSLNKAEGDTNTEEDSITRVVGGNDCPLGQCPWQALLVDGEGIGFCGGTILNHNYVLTAAHCINKTKTVKVIVGEVDMEAEERRGQLYTVEKIFRHNLFVPETYNADIALIKLRNPIQFSQNVIPACLPTPDFANQILMTQSTGTVSGFGRTHERGRASPKLQVVKLPYVDRKTCKLSSNFAITDNMFCAGYDTIGKDACQGDSGGPHVTEYRGTYFVTGVVSWGEGCAREGKYGVFTKVSKFIGWLKRTMKLRPRI